MDTERNNVKGCSITRWRRLTSGPYTSGSRVLPPLQYHPLVWTRAVVGGDVRQFRKDQTCSTCTAIKELIGTVLNWFLSLARSERRPRLLKSARKARQPQKSAGCLYKQLSW